MGLDLVIHCRDGRTRRALCKVLNERIESRRDFEQMLSWDLTHYGQRMCRECQRLIENAEPEGETQ